MSLSGHGPADGAAKGELGWLDQGHARPDGSQIIVGHPLRQGNQIGIEVPLRRRDEVQVSNFFWMNRGWRRVVGERDDDPGFVPRAERGQNPLPYRRWGSPRIRNTVGK